MNDLYVICCINGIDFYNLSLAEIEDILNYKRKSDRMNQLQLAYWMGCFVMNEKSNDTYKDIQSNILGMQDNERLKNDIKRYRMISERLGLKFPKVVNR